MLAAALAGGEDRTFQAGGVVLRREHDQDLTEAVWLAELFAGAARSGSVQLRKARGGAVAAVCS